MLLSPTKEGLQQHLDLLHRFGQTWALTVNLSETPEILGSSPGSVAVGCDREAHGAAHNWPSVVRVREGLAGRDILVSLCTSDSCGGPGAVHADQVARCTVFPPTHWCNLLKDI